MYILIRSSIILLIILFSKILTAQVTLDGTLSENATSFYWRQVSGMDVQLETPDSVKCKVFGLNKDGVYTFELKAINQYGYDLDSVNIIIKKGILSIIDDSTLASQINVIITPQLKIKITSPIKQRLTISLYNIAGQLLQRQELLMYEGVTFTKFNKPTTKGIYVLVFDTPLNKLAQKVFVE